MFCLSLFFKLYTNQYMCIFQLVKTVIMAQIALLYVLQIVKHVDTRTDCVIVKQDGWAQTAQEVRN